LLGAVNQYSDADYYSALIGYCCHNLSNGIAGGKDIIDDENSLPGVNVKASPKSSLLSALFFSEYATNA